MPRTQVPLTGRRVLHEYGARDGPVTQRLASKVGMATLAELPAGMRAVLERKVAEGDLPPSGRIWDLKSAGLPAPDELADVVVTVMALHHIPDLHPVLRGSAEFSSVWLPMHRRPRRGGRLLPDAGFEGHHGFVRSELRAWLDGPATA